jgi:hypothetical protein
MSWWDEEFNEFLQGLFGSVLGTVASVANNPVNRKYNEDNKGWDAAAQLAADKAALLADKTGKILAEHDKAGAPKPAATPSPSATPTPTPSPTPTSTASPGSSSTNGEFGQISGTTNPSARQTQGTVGGLDPNSPVYESRTRPKSRSVGGGRGKRASVGTVDQTRTLGEVANDPYGWEAKKVIDVAKLLVEAGYMSPNDIVDRANVAKWWTYLATTSAQMYARGMKANPMDLLKRQAFGLPGSGASEPKTTTSTSTQYTVTNATTAKQLAHAALSQRAGREASDEEVAEFIAALRKEEKANPQVTKATTTTNAKGTSSTSTSTVREGVDVSAFQRQWTDEYDTEEAKAYQAAGIMMPWLFDALRSPV